MNTVFFLTCYFFAFFFSLRMRRSWLGLLAAIVLAIVASSMFSRDAANYTTEYNAWANASLHEVITFSLGIEPAFRWISYILGKFRLPFWSLALVFSCISLPLIYAIIKKAGVDKNSGYLVFLSYFFLLQSCTQLRAGVASALGLMGIIALSSGDRKKAAGLYLLAMLFHFSAMIYVVSFLFSQKEFDKRIYISALFISIMLFFAGIDLPKTVIFLLGDGRNNIFTDKYLQYKALMVTGEGMNIRVFNPIVMINLTASLALIVMTNAETTIEIMCYKFIMLSFTAYFLLIPIPSWAFRAQEFMFFPIVIVAGKMKDIIKYEMHNVFLVFYCISLVVYILFFQKLFSI